MPTLPCPQRCPQQLLQCSRSGQVSDPSHDVTAERAHLCLGVAGVGSEALESSSPREGYLSAARPRSLPQPVRI